MKLTKVLIAIALMFGMSTGTYAKENKKLDEDKAMEKAQKEFVKKLGSKKSKLDVKEIKEGFVFKSGKGKVTLLILWTKDCKSCVKDVPNLNRLLLDFRGKLNIIAVEISGMSSKELQSFARDKKALYTLVSGVENKNFVSTVMKKFGFKKSLPFTIVLGYTGHNNGIIKGITDVNEMETFIEKIISHYEKKKAVKPIKKPKKAPEKKK